MFLKRPPGHAISQDILILALAPQGLIWNGWNFGNLVYQRQHSARLRTLNIPLPLVTLMNESIWPYATTWKAPHTAYKQLCQIAWNTCSSDQVRKLNPAHLCQINPTGIIMNTRTWYCHTIFLEMTLTHCGLVTSYGDKYLHQHWFR